MDFVDKNIEKYVEALSDKESSLLKEINEYTINHAHQPRMLSGHLQGRILSFISKIKHPKNILEIGTYTGYSALCLAEGLATNGKIFTIDRNEELINIQNKYFEESGNRDKIVQLTGNAVDILMGLNENFDLIFIDADKENYIKYFEIVSKKLNPNGIIISDNVLWSGKVVEESDNDQETDTLKKFNKLLSKDERFETIILPLRDGLSISRLI